MQRTHPGYHLKRPIQVVRAAPGYFQLTLCAYLVMWLASHRGMPGSDASLIIVASFANIVTLVALLAGLVTTLYASSARTIGAIAAVTMGIAALTSPATALGTSARIVVLAAFGVLVANCVERLSWTIYIVAAAAISDGWSVASSSGLTNQLHSSHQGVVDLLSIFQPVPFHEPTRGFGLIDVAFAAMLLGFTAAFRLPLLKVTLLLMIALAGTGMAVYASGWTLPAIPAMALAWISVALPPLAAERSWRRRLAPGGSR